MAKKRDLKKDVDYLVSEVVSDCYTFMLIHGDKNEDKAMEIIESVIEKRNELIARINKPENKHDSKSVKAHYKSIQKDLIDAIDSSFTKLSELSK